MLYTVKQDLELCEQFKLSARQLMFLKIMIGDPRLTDSDQIKERKQLALKFQTVFKKCNITANELADLIARDIIEDYNDPGEVYFDLYELSGLWRNKLRLAVYPMPKELFDAYPINIIVQGRQYIGRNVSPEEIAMKYLSSIDKDEKRHLKILDDLRWAVEANELTIGLKKFVDTCYWDHLSTLREKHSIKKGGDNVRIG